ncbi:MAG: hypothetical protein AB1757_07195 [Acidobacteriota bacterium]
MMNHRDNVTENNSSTSKTDFVMERKGKLENLDRSFDLEFWQAQDSTARFSAAWELVLHAQRRKSKDVGEPRLQRHIESLQRQSG